MSTPDALLDDRQESDEHKTGQALAAQRFQMLSDIAKELSGDVVFPTCFDVAIRLRQVLDSPDASVDQVCRVLVLDPLISSKVLGLANSVAFNTGSGVEVRDLKSAVQRLGLNNVRSVALGLAMKQLVLSKEMGAFETQAKNLWDHAIRAACACQITAKRLTRLNPEDAFFAGLVHDIGAFYMLYRASRYSELRKRPDSLKYLVIKWHESIGESLLHALGMPDRIVEAVHEHDHPRPFPTTPRKLADLVYLANILVGNTADCIFPDKIAPKQTIPELEPYLALLPDIQASSREMMVFFTA
ncbi:MAG TPA: HDOD domain-containing protein [Rhodocyclaceae bacterium]